MSISPLITFKAGKCELDTSCSPPKVSPVTEKGYVYLYVEEELVHFCWRNRNIPLDNPEIDLMILQDARFQPYKPSGQQSTSRTNGRIFNLKFSSSSQRYLFWMQSKAEGSDPAKFSARDIKIGEIVDRLLQGEELDAEAELAQAGNTENDGDDAMEDVQGEFGGGGQLNAPGDDYRQDGQQSRDGGADGGRAPATGETTDHAAIMQNFLASLRNQPGFSSGSSAQPRLYTTLPDLLPTATTIPLVQTLTAQSIDNLLSNLPPVLLLLSQESADQIDGMVEPSASSAAAALEAMSMEQKRSLLVKVLRSPQFNQSLGSLTVAIRDGGLPMIGEALGLQVSNNGLVKGGSVPLGGGEAVEAFVESVKKHVMDNAAKK